MSAVYYQTLLSQVYQELYINTHNLRSPIDHIGFAYTLSHPHLSNTLARRKHFALAKKVLTEIDYHLFIEM